MTAFHGHFLAPVYPLASPLDAGEAGVRPLPGETRAVAEAAFQIRLFGNRKVQRLREILPCAFPWHYRPRLP